MLRSTGFFRGIDCPFNIESYNGKNDGEICNRPYCHFRHSKQTRESFNTTSSRKTLQSFSKQKGTGYDPYNPEVFRPGDRQNGEGTSDLAVPAFLEKGALELEMVNRAIEAMRNEVEREQKKLSHIGDQEYDPTTSTKRHKSSVVASPLEYDPGSYQMATDADYNPTPRSSKYTLDTDDQNTYASAMEYIPTKTVTKKPTPRFSPSPPSPASIPPTSSKYKYTLDNSKPPTDLEYDPLSNFSARPGSKNNKSPKEQRSVGAVGTEGCKRRLLSTTAEKQLVDDTDSGYIPTKKPRIERTPAVDSKKYSASFSESDDESSGTEYRPTSISRLQRRRDSAGSIEGPANTGEERRENAAAAKRKHRLSSETKDDVKSISCDTEDSESLDTGSLRDQTTGKKAASKILQKKSSSTGKVDGEQKECHKKSSEEKGGDEKKTEAVKKLAKQGLKKESKNERGSAEEKVRVKEGDKVRSSTKEPLKPKSSGKSGKVEKLKGECGQERRGGESHAKNIKTSSKTAKDSTRQSDMRNGKLESSRGEKEKKSSHRRDGSKEKRTESKPSLDSKTKPDKGKQRSLSHADLFGDESAEEEEEEGNVVRKSAAAFKRRSLITVEMVSELSSSSSEDEGGQEEDRIEDDDDDDDDDNNNGGGEDDFSSLQIDLDFDSDPLEECLRIFNESKDVKTEDKGRQAKQPSTEVEEEKVTESSLTTLFPGQKKRVSHFMSKGNPEPSSKPVVRPYRRPTPQEVCYQRMQIAQQQAAQLAAVVKTTTSTPSPAMGFTGEKKRVAHRPNPTVSAADSAGRQLGGAVPPHSSVASKVPSVKTQTLAGILSKTVSTVAQRRVAHTPTLKSSSLQRPVIPTEFGAKVPTNIRQRYLNIFIDECLKFCPSEERAFQMALDEEKVVYERSSSRNIYLNVAVNTLKKLRGKTCSPASLATKGLAVKANKKSLSHEEVLGGRLAAKTSFTINRKGKQPEEELRGTTLYKKLKAYMMTEEQLQEHGYPRPHPERSGRAIIYNVQEKKSTDPLAKICCRCGAEYRVTANGNCVRREECTYHWGRLRRHKVPGGWETQYSCCAGAVGSLGCQVAKQHVQDGRKEALDGYVKTFEKPLPADGNAGVYALDCEMCYTKQGLELTRVTVIDADLKVIYDTFVKPESKVVDYNTRFSGVTQEDLESTTITLRDVQAVLLSMFSADSILIGHSLESDLLALKILHSTVVDTAIVFPHRLGLPYKRALRTLMADYLKRIIQDNVEGHDSSEDASACMQLMMWKIREDAKVKR